MLGDDEVERLPDGLGCAKTKNPLGSRVPPLYASIAPGVNQGVGGLRQDALGQIG
jgi:hypothetical protein